MKLSLQSFQLILSRQIEEVINKRKELINKQPKQKIKQNNQSAKHTKQRMRSGGNSPRHLDHFHHRSTYYSKTQQSFFKAYASQQQFTNKLNDLLNAIDKRKVIKLIQQIKQANKSFRKYLNIKKIVFIKIEDVIAFEDMLQKSPQDSVKNYSEDISSQILGMKKMMLPAVSPHMMSPQRRSKVKRQPTIIKTFSSLRKSKPEAYTLLQKQMIKKGFMSLLQKLQTLKKDEFINQTQYLQGVIIRQSQKLKDYGFDQMDENNLLRRGRKLKVKKISLCEEINNEEKINGLYPMIMKSIRQETVAIESVQNTFELVMKS